eukprot:15395354-Alexandrium_andersonii.AAC.1
MHPARLVPGLSRGVLRPLSPELPGDELLGDRARPHAARTTPAAKHEPRRGNLSAACRGGRRASAVPSPTPSAA